MPPFPGCACAHAFGRTACAKLAGARSPGFTPTRSLSDTSCHEMVATPVGSRYRRSSAWPKPRRRPAIAPHEPCFRGLADPSHARPARAGRPRSASRCKREDPRAESASVPPTRVDRTSPPGSAGRVQGALARPPGIGLLAQSAHPGSRAASPASPRRATRSAAPEVPSIEALPSSTTLGLRPESLPRQAPTCAGACPGPSPLSRTHLGRGSPQLVTSLWRTHDAFFEPRRDRRLDGQTAARNAPSETRPSTRALPHATGRVWGTPWGSPSSQRHVASPSTSAIGMIRGSMCRRTSRHQSLSFDTLAQRKNARDVGFFVHRIVHRFCLVRTSGIPPVFHRFSHMWTRVRKRLTPA